MHRILIVDDNAASRALARAILESGEMQLTEAADGGEALDRIARSAPDLVLLDIDIPVLDGYAVLARLRAQPALTRLPVIAVTANAMQGAREKALAAGFDEYVTKPVHPAALRKQVARFLAASGRRERDG
jgi:two-component system, cell cycle response regulator DivK